MIDACELYFLYAYIYIILYYYINKINIVVHLVYGPPGHSKYIVHVHVHDVLAYLLALVRKDVSKTDAKQAAYR